MNEQMQSAVATMIEKATSGVEAGIDFLSAEIPDAIHQLLMWKAIESFGLMLVSLAAAFALYKCSALTIKWAASWEENGEDFMDHPESMFLVFPGLALLSTAIFCFSIDWLKIWIAPKVYLIEYAASLAK